MAVVTLRQNDALRCRWALAAAGWLLGLAAAGPVAAAVSTPADGADAELTRLRDFLTGADRTFATRRDAAQILIEKDTPAARAVLLEVLSSPAPSEATRAALEVLASRGGADAALVDPLFNLLESDDADIRRAAAGAFGAYQGNEKVLEGLETLVTGTSSPTAARLAAVEALAGLFDKRAIGILVDLTETPPHEVAAAAAEALADLTGRSDLPPTAEAWRRWWADHRDEPEHQLLTGFIRRFRDRLEQRLSQLEEVRKRLLDHLAERYEAGETKEKVALAVTHLSDAVPAVRALGARQAARIAPAALAASNGTGKKVYPDLVSALLGRVDDTSATVRAAVADALAAWRESSAGPVLLARLPKETVPETRAALAGALGGLRVAKAVDPLVEMLASLNQTEVVAAAGALGQIGDRSGGDPEAVQSALEPLGRLARSAGPAAVREAACLALARIAPPSAEKVLAAALDDPEASVRYAAAQGVGNLEEVGAGTVEALVGRLQDKDKGVRQAAAAALAQVGGDKAAAEMAARLQPDAETDTAVRNALWDAIRALAEAAPSPERAGTLGDVFFARGGPEAPEDMQRAAKLYQAAISKIPAAERSGQQAITLYEKLVDAHVAAGTPERAVPTLRQLLVLTPAENAVRIRELNRQLGLILLARDPCTDSVPPLVAAMKGAGDEARATILDAVRDRAEALLEAEKPVQALDLVAALEAARPESDEAPQTAALRAVRARAAEAALPGVLSRLGGTDEQAAAATVTLKKIGPAAAGPLLDLLASTARKKKASIEARALAALEAVTGRSDHGYDLDAPLEERLARIEAWHKAL
ncbi:MAG: HEAT repeat domain-containing protein [Phycisphaerae bacterium]